MKITVFEGSFDKLMTELSNGMKRFIFLEDNKDQNEDFNEYIALARFFLKKGDIHSYKVSLEKAEKMLLSQPQRDIEFYHNQFVLQQELEHFSSLHTLKDTDEKMLALHQSLDSFFCIAKMEYSCALVFRRKNREITVGDSLYLMNTITDLIKKKGQYLAVEMLDIYEIIYQLSLADVINPGLILKLESLTEQLRHKSVIKKEKLSNFYAYIRSFWTRRYMQSRTTEHLIDLANVYKRHHTNNMLYIDEKINPQTILQILKIMYKIKDFDFAKEFLENLKAEQIVYLDDAKELLELYWAEYYFNEISHKTIIDSDKDYNESNTAFKEVLKRIRPTYTNPTHKVTSDILVSKIYFLEDWDKLQGRIKASIRYIKLNGLKIFDEANNFYKILQKILKHEFDKQELSTLLDEVEQNKTIIEREWLLEIIKQKMAALLNAPSV